MKVENVKDFQVFYGENEAGKSTIMAFIHAILFGFPTKSQSELRYEPKNNAKYGGKLRVFSPDYGHAVIERVKGKAAVGDVSVTLENGVSGGEELLKSLLSSIDKGLYQAIFSFNLYGLQNIHQMKREEMGKFLFSAGTLGSERLSLTEIELQKELDYRFKPSGKKPVINEKLFALHQLNDELKKAAKKNAEYSRLVKQKEEIQQEMAKIRDSLHQNQKRVNKLKEWKKIQPFVVEEMWIENELKPLNHISFPPNGIERLGQLNQLIPPFKAQLTSFAERLEKLKGELVAVEPNHLILEAESEITELIDQRPLYEQIDSQKKQGEIRLLEYNQKLEEIKEKLHLSISEEDFLTINTNIFIKNQVNELSAQGKILKETKEKLDLQFNEEKGQLEALEENVRNIDLKVIPDQERIALEKQVKKSDNRRTLEIELKAVQEKVSLYKKVEEQEKIHAANTKKQNQIQLFTFSSIFLMAALYGLLFNQWLIAILGFLCLIIVGIIFLKRKSYTKKTFYHLPMSELLEEARRLDLELKTVESHSELADIQTKLALDNRYREELQVQRIKLEQQLIQYDKVIVKFEKWESEFTEYREKLKEMCHQLKIPLTIADSFLQEAFLLIEQYKMIVRDKNLLLNELKGFKIKHEDLGQRLRSLVTRFLPDQQNLEFNHCVFLLRNILKEEQEKAAYYKEKQQNLVELNQDFHQVQQESQHIEDEKIALFQEAKVKDEQQFFELGEKTAKRQKLLERMTDLQKQLHSTYLSELERNSYLKISDGDEIIMEHEEEAEFSRKTLTKLQEQQASIKMEIQLLEEGGVYSELLHQFKEKQHEIAEYAKEWSVYSLAQDILSKTIEKYKNIHLPKMLTKAEEYLVQLTNGQYTRIIPQPSGAGFLIERKDHTIFEANELSQATTEQVYVSIRLSLATTLYEKFQLPIIIDDSFVNFDRNRTEKMIDLLKDLKHNQILFFTCHSHLLEYFQEKDIYGLSKPAIHAN